MDAPLKQRLVGAAVLVAAAVVIVPMLLDGGYRPPEVNTRDMAPMPADQLPPAIEPLPPEVVREIDRGLVAPPTALEAVVETPPVAHVPPPAPAPAKVLKPTLPPPATPPVVRAETPAPAAEGERWAVQLGSFSSRENADLLVRRLESLGRKAHLVEVRESHGVSYRVRAGPVSGRAAALDLRNQLAKSPDLRGILVRE
jgi:DedD protein